MSDEFEINFLKVFHWYVLYYRLVKTFRY